MPINPVTDNIGMQWASLGIFGFSGDSRTSLYKWFTVAKKLPVISPTFKLITAIDNNINPNQKVRFRYRLEGDIETRGTVIYPKYDPFIVEFPLPNFVLDLIEQELDFSMKLEFMPMLINPRKPPLPFNMEIQQKLNSNVKRQIDIEKRINSVETKLNEVLDNL